VPSGDTPTSFSQVVEAITPSVVFIYAQGTVSSSTGSGVIMHEDGYILTNRHVVEDAQTVEVTLQDRRIFTATDFWMDDLADLAVVKINGSNLPEAANFADYTEIKVGDWAVAVGHPIGLSPTEGGATVTAGIISNLERSFAIGNIEYFDIIQTDAAINPGNSGGPLVNLDGDVIGINSAISTEAQNIGYAINVATAERVFDDLIDVDHEVIRPFIGVRLDEVTPQQAMELSLAKTAGALIAEVVADSPAEDAGILVNDVITAMEGIDPVKMEVEITSVSQLLRELWLYQAHDTVKITVWRNQSEASVNLTLAERP
jgi:serine protease Do